MDYDFQVPINQVQYTRIELARILLLPDRKDFMAFIGVLLPINFIQVTMFELQFESYWQSLYHYSFLPFYGLCFLFYWSYRYCYTSVFQMMGHETNRRKKEKEGEIDFKFFGLWFSLVLLALSPVF